MRPSLPASPLCTASPSPHLLSASRPSSVARRSSRQRSTNSPSRTRPTTETGPTRTTAHQDLPARWSLLEAPDLLRVLRGRRRLATHIEPCGDNSYTYTGILHPHYVPWWEDGIYAEQLEQELKHCGRPTLDPEKYPFFALLSSIFSQAFREVSPGIRDPLKAMKDCALEYERTSEASMPSRKTLCDECEEGLKSWVPWARRYLWERLPEIFELSTPAA